MISFYQRLEKIKEKPGLYIGYPSVSNLFIFLCGYRRACQDMGLALSDEEREFHEFQPWLQKRFRLSTSASWAKIILLYSSDETHAFQMFFELLEEFLNSRSQPDRIEQKSEEKQIVQTSFS